MSDWFEIFTVKGRPGPLEARSIWVAIVLSILLHVAALWTWLPQLRTHLLEKPEREAGMPLTVQLAPPAAPAAPSPPPSPARKARPRAEPQSPPAAAPRESRPPPVALKQPAPDALPLQPPAVASTPAPPSPAGDLSSYIESRRRARAEPAQPPSPPAVSESRAPPAEDDATRSKRIVSFNLGLDRKPGFGPERGGGVFDIVRVGYSDAEFMFYGWNKDIRRTTTQSIEVRKGNNTDIRLAIVRRMITIIREQASEDDFNWESKRLGRVLTLSSRTRDQSGLEDFLLREFPEFGSAPIQR